MPLRIKADHARFREIVRGRIQADLKRYVRQGEMLGRQGGGVVRIPAPQVGLPRFRFGEKGRGGVGQGEGEPGAPLGAGEAAPGGGAGDAAGEHALEVEVPLEELARMLGEALALPRVRPGSDGALEAAKARCTGVNTAGPESLRHFRRSFKQALRRQLASGTYDPRDPVVAPERRDRRYRTFRPKPQPGPRAAILYLMDVSGSMGDEQKELVRTASFWIDTWLRANYRGLETRYVVHDATAREVDRDTFFRTRESGGTMISSAYKLAAELVRAHYAGAGWNAYVFHFSDGDNWSAEDTRQCLRLLGEGLLPGLNQFAYGQVESPYGSGQFIKDVREAFGADERVVACEIPDRDGIYAAIRAFLGRGR